MVRLPSIVNKVLGKPNVDPDLKRRVINNNEVLLEVFSQNMTGAKSCALLGGQKCIGQMCMFFRQYKTVDRETKKETPYWMCDFVQTPQLLIELNNNIRELIELNKSKDGKHTVDKENG